MVKVWLGDIADHYYILSRFLLSRMLTVTKRVPLVILVCGTACTGKSTIATQLAQRLNLPNVLQDQDKLISNLKIIQDYLCSFEPQGLTTVNISATTFPQTLDWLHSYLLQVVLYDTLSGSYVDIFYFTELTRRFLCILQKLQTIGS